MRTQYCAFVLSVFSTASAHSWLHCTALHCTAHNNTGILADMKVTAAAENAPVIDRLMPWFANLCQGWPRAKQNPGNWTEETTNYLWDISKAKFESKESHACHPNQRTPNQHLEAPAPGTKLANLAHHDNPAPMATAAAGSNITLMFGGNGHTRGNNAGPNGDPGRVVVYWVGEKEKELVDIKELNDDTLVQENGFSEESFSYQADKAVTSPTDGLMDKGNWMTLRL
ncbi:hypothetical protein CC86DRAFT_300945 [Ophiobolus disseminans]|uniref:Uncharacterized protein n=1 Tax=Ophiobolus disseminans TaxID=1469910 RepID=A0A6A6ZNC5_9PLEO|nr:hypothetical protein CC86DRAFT_300945 [Ophiobolus disseminans]